MPYVSPAGPSSQSCLPRKAIASTVLEQTRRNAAAAGKTSRPSSSGGPANEVDQASKPEAVDTAAATSQLANQLEAFHIDEPAIIIPKTLSSASLTPSSSDVPSSAVSPTLSTSKSSSDSDDPVNAYKLSLYTYTREKLLEAQETPTSASPGSPGKKASTGPASGSAYSQFGAKQSGMQKLAAKKLLARQLNA